MRFVRPVPRSAATNRSRRAALVAAAMTAWMLIEGVSPAATATAVLAPASPAAVAPTVAPPVIAAAVPQGPPGTALTLSGSGFQPREPILLYVGTGFAGTAQADVVGHLLAGGLRIPAATPPGWTPLVAVGSSSHLTAQTRFTVRSEWAQPQFGAGQTNANPFENILNRTNVLQLRETWSISGAGAFGGPIISGGLVIWHSGEGLRAFDARTGASVWTVSDLTDVVGSPVAAAGSILVASEPALGAPTVTSLDLRTGRRRWVSALPPVYPANVALSYAEGAVYAMVAHGALTKLDAASGTPLWSVVARANDQLSRAVGAGRFFVLDDDSNAAVVAYDLATGAERWHQQLGNSAAFPPLMALSGTRIVAADRAGLVALDVATGAMRWRHDFFTNGEPGNLGTEQLAVTPTAIYTPVEALNPVTGATMFRFPEFGSPVVANGLVFELNLFAINVFDGTTGALVGQLARGVDGSDTFDGTNTYDIRIVDGIMYLLTTTRSPGVTKVRAFTLPAKPSPWATLDDKTVGPNHLAYSSGWKSGTNAGDYQGTDSYTSVRGAAATFTFTGTGFRLWFSAAVHHGIADVTAERRTAAGTVVRTTFSVDQYSAVRRDGVSSVTSPLMPNATYTVRITARGTHNAAATASVISLDRIDLGRV